MGSSKVVPKSVELEKASSVSFMMFSMVMARWEKFAASPLILLTPQSCTSSITVFVASMFYR